MGNKSETIVGSKLALERNMTGLSFSKRDNARCYVAFQIGKSFLECPLYFVAEEQRTKVKVIFTNRSI